MSSLHHPSLEKIGVRAATTLDVASEIDTDALLAGIARKKKRLRTKQTLVATMASALLVFLVAFFALRPARETTPAFATLGPKSAGVSEVPLAFEDGSNVVVKQGATAQLREVRPHGATLALDRGTVDVHVVHFEDTRWDVLAGPFDVKVTGTRFDATWDPEAKKLTVAMKEGSVQVSGPCVDERLVAPNAKTFSCEAPPRTSGHEPDAPAPSAEPAPPAKPVVVESAASLFARADRARLAGDRAEAQKLYLLVRDRHPRAPEAAKAAFLLGRLAESSGATDDAARWYSTVTRESPESPYAQDALGRSMELAQKRGEATRARALADEYLKKHPGGPHRAYATSILEAP